MIAADFVSRRLLGSLGALGYALCLAAFALGGSFPVLLVAAAVWGAASDAFVHGLEVALVDLAGDDLATALGRVNALGAVSDLLGPLTLAGAAAAGLSWRVVFAAGAALMLGYAAWVALLRLPPPRPRSEAASPIATVLEVARDFLGAANNDLPSARPTMGPGGRASEKPGERHSPSSPRHGGSTESVGSPAHLQG